MGAAGCCSAARAFDGSSIITRSVISLVSELAVAGKSRSGDAPTSGRLVLQINRPPHAS